MIKSIVRITTDDTGKTYEFPEIPIGIDGNPEIWALRLGIAVIDNKGNPQLQNATMKTLHVERETLEKAGLIPFVKPEDKNRQPTETAKDLILRLLEMCEVYPSE